MWTAAAAAARDHARDGPRRELYCSETIEPRLSSHPALPASFAPVGSAPIDSQSMASIAGTRHAPTATPDLPDGGVRHCPQDPEASGWDVLMGAVDIELRAKKAGPAQVAPGAAGAAAAGADGAIEDAQRFATTTTTACSIPLRPSSGDHTAHPPAARLARPSSPSLIDLGHDAPKDGPRTSSEDPATGGRADTYSGNKEAAACRALTTLPRVFLEHTALPPPVSVAREGGTATAGLPGFSMTKDVPAVLENAAWAQEIATSAPQGAITANTARATATSAHKRMIDAVFMPETSPSVTHPVPPPPRLLPQPGQPLRSPLGPVSHPAGPRVGAVATQTPSAALAVPTSARSVDASRVKPTRAKTKAVVKSRAGKAKAPKVSKTPKPRIRKGRARRGPVGQSSFKGVCITPAGTWRAVIYVDRKQKYLGVFDNEFDAARAYDAAAIKYFPGGPPALNNPDAVERQLNELSAVAGKPITTAGSISTQDLPERLRELIGSEKVHGASSGQEHECQNAE